MEMKNRFQEAIQNVQRQRHLARRSVAMVLVLAMLTAMSVSWRLHQDGIALTADDTRYYCGKEEHKHTDDCYIEGTEPICGYEEGEIVEETMDLADDAGDGDSSAADWDEAGSEPESEPATQEEPEPEVVLHHHTSDCYEEEEVLTCGIESDHVHQDYCYDQETGELLCTEHEHTDDCYTLEEVLVCGQEEGEPEETDDGAALYDRDENSAEESDSAEEPETAADPEPEKEATKPETDDEIDTGYTVHHHTAECYGKVLICGKEEHEHTAACLVNPNAEIDAEYDAKTPARTDADWAQDMVLVAKSQLGYTESKADVDEDGNGYTMYADQYYKDKPMVYADWDCTFVAYCLYHAGVPQDIIPQYASISALRGELARMNSEYYTDDPQGFASILPGDIVMYKNAEGRETIGVVSDAAVDEETDLTTALTVISGDVATGYESDGETTIDQVAEVSVALSDVTSFVSVNAAEGYGVDDLMDDDVAVQDMADAELLEALKTAEDFGKYIPKVGGFTISETKFVSEPKESYRTTVNLHFDVPQGEAKDFQGDKYAYKIDLPKDFGLDPDWMNLILGQDHPLLSGLTRIGSYRFVQKEDGTYAILLKFNQDYLNSNPELQGDISFAGEIGTEYGKQDGTIEIKFNDNITLNVPKNKITYPADKTNAYDIKTSKSGSYDSKTHQLTYTVTVVSKKGTPGDVRFDDKIDKIEDLKGLTLGTPTITVEKCTVTETRDSTSDNWPGDGSDGTFSEVNPSGLEYGGNGKISGTLPKMETNVSENGLKREYTKYRVTYVYDVSGLGNADYSLINNVSTSSTGQNTVEIKSGDKAEVPIKNKYTLTKTAGNYQNGKIQWTITFNENHCDITDAVLNDTMTANGTTISNVFAQAEEIQITPETGWTYVDNGNNPTQSRNEAVGIKFTAPEGQKNTEKYTITYTTKHTQGGTDYTVQNTANAKDSKGDSIDSVTTPGAVGRTGVMKYSVDSKAEENGNTLTIPWKVSIDFTNAGALAKDTIYADVFTENAEHWMTKKQAKALIESLKWSSTAYRIWQETDEDSDVKVDPNPFKVEFYTDNTIKLDGNRKITTQGTAYENLQGDAKIYGFRIVVEKDFELPDGKKALKINYSTTADTSQVKPGTVVRYRNLFDWQAYNFDYSKSNITKMDGEDRTGTTTVESEDGTITWKIKIHTNKIGLNGSVTVHDDLPAGVVVESVKREGDNSVINVTPGVEFKKNWNNDVLTGSYDQSENTLEMTLSNQNYLKPNTDYVFIIKCKAVSDPKDGTTAIVPGKSYEYTNKASAWFGSNKDAPIGESSQTQEWSEKDNTPVIKPIGKDVQTVNNGQTLNYTVEINPEGKKLLENSTEGLKVRDTLSVQVHPDYVTLKDNAGQGTTDKVTVSAALNQKSVKLCYATRNAETGKLESTGQEVPGYKMTLDSHVDPEHPGRMLYMMEFTALPDDKPMLLTYTYDLVSDIDINYKNKWQLYGYWEQNCIKNTAELEEIGYTTTAEDTRLEFAHAGTSGSVVSTYNLTLKKVAEGDYTKLLQGAVFQLRKYENGEFVDVAGQTYKTDFAGTITIQQGKNAGDFEFDTNTLYCLVETEPPEGYALSQAPVYFYFKDDADREHTLPTIEEMDQAVDLNSQSKQVYVENEPNLTSVTVEKKWQNSDGTKLDNPPVNSIGFKLVQLVSSTPPISSSSATVKGSIQGAGNAVYTFDGTTPYSEGTVMTLTITYPSARNALQYNNKLIPKIFWNGEEVTPDTQTPDGDNGIVKWTYTCTLKAGRNTISGYIEDYDSSRHVIEEPQYKQPAAPAYQEKSDYGTYTLTAADNWRMVIGNLPRSNPERTEYYSYKIVETTSMDGYTVTYNTESGVVGGYLVMVNTKTPEQEEPTYELPSTGSPGGTVPYTAGGAAIALAAVLCGYNSRRKRKRGEE